MGRNPFATLSLPEAVIRFKQGFGRLIRTRLDRGVVVVLDSRILPGKSEYADLFLSSLPAISRIKGGAGAVIRRTKAWLGGKLAIKTGIMINSVMPLHIQRNQGRKRRRCRAWLMTRRSRLNVHTAAIHS